MPISVARIAAAAVAMDKAIGVGWRRWAAAYQRRTAATLP